MNKVHLPQGCRATKRSPNPQKYLVHFCSISERKKADLTLEPPSSFVIQHPNYHGFAPLLLHKHVT